MPEEKISPALIVVPVLGLGLLGVLAVAAASARAPEEPEPVVTIALKNPPPEATVWQLIIYDWDEVSSINSLELGIEEPAIFDIPPEWTFPLRVDILIYTPPATYYRMHSTKNAFPQFHREVFIPDYGGYFFNVATGLFE